MSTPEAADFRRLAITDKTWIRLHVFDDHTPALLVTGAAGADAGRNVFADLEELPPKSAAHRRPKSLPFRIAQRQQAHFRSVHRQRGAQHFPQHRFLFLGGPDSAGRRVESTQILRLHVKVALQRGQRLGRPFLFGDVAKIEDQLVRGEGIRLDLGPAIARQKHAVELDRDLFDQGTFAGLL